MGLIICIASFFGARALARRSLGDGVGFLLVVGSFYGLVRAVLLDGFTHFWFDAAVLGAYWGGLPGALSRAGERVRTLRLWVWVLCALALLTILISPFVDAQPVLVQFVGLRPAALFVPMLLLGASMEQDQWLRFSRWAVWVAIASGLVAIAELIFGVDAIFPANEASAIIYASQDVGGGEFRIPSTFSSAHAYAGTMLGLLPVLLLRVRTPGHSAVLSWSAMAIAAFGVLIAGARTPVLIFAVVAAVALLGTLRSARQTLILVIIAVGLAATVPRFQQFRRIETLQDQEMVAGRFEASVNLSLVEAVGKYPLGRGLASAFGTSIPYFLANEALPQLGAENEYARIALEEGLVGVLIWLAFVAFSVLRDPRHLCSLGGLPDRMMYVLCVASWAQGLIGVGMLAAVPGTLILFTQTGFIASSEGGRLAKRRSLFELRTA